MHNNGYVNNNSIVINNYYARTIARSNDNYILNNINTSFVKGEIVVIIGRSGSGKTTLIKSILGLLPKSLWDTSGEIYINGNNIVKLKQTHMQNIRGWEISAIFQDPSETINPGLMIKNQFYIKSKRKSINSIKMDIAQDLLEELGFSRQDLISNVYNSYPNELSEGQKQRICIALSLISQSDYYIADEPTSSLDVTNATRLMSLLKDLHSHKYLKSIIFITHDIEIAQMMEPDRVIIIEKGNIVEEKSGKDVFHLPKSKEFIQIMDAFVKWKKSKNNSLAKINKKKVLLNASNIKAGYYKKRVFTRKYSNIIDNINININYGEIHGVMGESGHGKTTIANSILFLVDYIGGNIKLDGMPSIYLNYLDDYIYDGSIINYRNKVALMFQQVHNSFDPTRNIYSNYIDIINAKNYKKNYVISKIIEHLEKLDLTKECLYKKPGELSSGELQRLSMIRSILLNAKLLILDEPFRHVDFVTKTKMAAIIKNLYNNESEGGILLITHNIWDISKLCTNLSILKSGNIVECDKLKIILSNPNNAYTKMLVNTCMKSNRIKGVKL